MIFDIIGGLVFAAIFIALIYAGFFYTQRPLGPCPSKVDIQFKKYGWIAGVVGSILLILEVLVIFGAIKV
jgi:hypothetical protein